jgi:hypothetical protein
MHPTVFVFGNPIVPHDAAPFHLLPTLRSALPHIIFQETDPNEEREYPREVVILDTIVGSTRVTLFESLDLFETAPRASCHDFDAYALFRLLQKLGKVERVHIVGVPPVYTESVCADVVDMLSKIFPTSQK